MSSGLSPAGSPALDTAGRRKRRKKIILAPFILLLPWFIGIAVFRAYPLFRSFYLSLTHFHIMDPEPIFAGLDNYIRIFTNDRVFNDSVFATLRFVFFGTPIVIVVSFLIAYVLNFKLKGVNLFRNAY